MLLDQHLILSDKQAVTATAASTHTIDQGGKGDAHNRLVVFCKVDEAFAGLSKMVVALQCAETAAFTSPKTLLSAEFETADLTKDKSLLKAVFPLGSARFVRGYYTVTGTGTAGKVSLFVTDEADM